MKLNIKNIIWIVVAVVVVGAIAFKLIGNKQKVDSRSEVKVVETEIAVTVVSAQVKEVSDELQFVGTANPDKNVTVAAESPGKIVSLNFKLGDYVSRGAVLASIDDVNRRLSVENAELNYKKAKDDYERYQVLRQGDAVSETQLRDMKVAYENAEIQVKNAKKALGDTRIVAPFSGYITSKNTELGAYVNPGTAIAGLADISQLRVLVSVSESNVYMLNKGQEVNVTTNVFPDATFKGIISNISPQGDNAHTYPVEIVIPNNTKNQLKAGTFVNVNVYLGGKAKALLIPRDAIVSSVKDPSVYVVENNIAKLTKINTGQEYETNIEVVSGLNEGTQVVTNGQINLTDGVKVLINNK